MAQVSSTSTASPETIKYKSLALSELMRQLEPERRYSILDLGRACPENVNHWSRFGARICFPDFYREFISSVPPAPIDEGAADFPFEKLLPPGSDRSFDIILGWDLFNYFEHDHLVGLIRWLRGICHPGTYVFVLVSSLQQIFTEPTLFRIMDSEHLLYENRTPVARRCPQYQPRDIKLMMAGFEVLVSFLLRHGVQEYLFVYRGTP